MVKIRKVTIGVHNLSGSLTEVRRTGIQEVVFQVLRELINFQSDEIELIPVLRLPLCNRSHTPFFIATHFNASFLVLDATLSELGVDRNYCVRRWPYLAELFRDDYSETRYDTVCIEAIAASDLYFEVSLSDIRNVMDSVRELNSQIKSGLCIHDLGPLKFPEYVDHGMDAWFRTQYLECLRQVDFTIAVSRHSAIDFSEWQAFYLSRPESNFYVSLPSTRSLRAENKVDPAMAEKYPFIGKSSYICSIATLEPRKNLVYLIQSFRRFRTLFSDPASSVELVLVGYAGWKNRELLDIINEAPEGIRVTGFIPKEDVQALFVNSLCLVMPSHYEGFGLPVAEARVAGIPVITCLNSSLPEASELQEFYVRPWLPDDLACQISKIKQQSLSKKLGSTEDHHSHQAGFGWPQVMDSWIQIFKKFLEPHTSQSKNRMRSYFQKSNPKALVDVGSGSALSELRRGTTEAGDFFHSHCWTPLPWLSSEIDDSPNIQISMSLVDHLLPGERHAVQQTARGSEGALQCLLGDASWMVLATPCRLEAIKGLERFTQRGGRILFLLGRTASVSKLYPSSIAGLARWVAAVVCENIEDSERLLANPLTRNTLILSDKDLFLGIENQDWPYVAGKLSAYFQEQYP